MSLATVAAYAVRILLEDGRSVWARVFCTGAKKRVGHVSPQCFMHCLTGLAYALQRGNALATPRSEYRFVGLRADDRWCLLCINRWLEALHASVAPSGYQDGYPILRLR